MSDYDDDDCGCEARRAWLLDHSPNFTHGFIRNFDGVHVAHSAMAGVISGLILFYLLRSRILPNG